MALVCQTALVLNLFGIGFPITLGVGMAVIALTLPFLSTPLQNLIHDGIEESRKLPRRWADRTRPPAPAPR